MDNAVLNVEQRGELGSRNSTRLRNVGFIPGIVYGKELDAKAIKVNRSNFIKFLGSGSSNRVIQLKIQGDGEYNAIIKDITYDDLKNEYVHLDFQQISLTEERTSTVPIRLHKGAKAESTSEIVIQQLEEIEVTCLPQNTPEYIDVDISNCSIGDKIVAGDLQLSDDVKLVTEPEVTIAMVIAARLEQEEETEKEEEQPVATTEEE